MDYINAINLLGVTARQRPTLTGEGIPTETTIGAVGELYMDTTTQELFKCISDDDGVYTWVSLLGDVETALDNIINIQDSLIGGGSK